MPELDRFIPADDHPRRRGLARLFPADPPRGPFRRSFFSAARPLADVDPGDAAARRHRHRHRPRLARGLQPVAGRQRDRRPGQGPAADLQLADEPVVALRAHPGTARHHRRDDDPAPAGQPVVGHSLALCVAAGVDSGAGHRAPGDHAAGLERGLRVRHGRHEHAVLVPVPVRLRGRPLLGGRWSSSRSWAFISSSRSRW